MHTPGHAIINAALLGGLLGHEGAIVLGAIAPDLPIFALYARERLRGTPEQTIWSVHYQRPGWLATIHGAHSFPLAALGALAAWTAGLPAVAVFFVSVFVHALGDLPVHAIDAHRHFWPFSQFRYHSPLSYWDTRFHARGVALVEALLVLAASLALHRRGASPAVLGLLVAVNLGYARNYVRSFVLA